MLTPGQLGRLQIVIEFIIAQEQETFTPEQLLAVNVIHFRYSMLLSTLYEQKQRK